MPVSEGRLFTPRQHTQESGQYLIGKTMLCIGVKEERQQIRGRVLEVAACPYIEEGSLAGWPPKPGSAFEQGFHTFNVHIVSLSLFWSGFCRCTHLLVLPLAVGHAAALSLP